MLIVSGTLEIAKSGIDKACAAALNMMAETARETGCLVYEFSQVIGSPGTFRVYEEWQDMAALKAHGASAHMQVFRAALAEIGVTSRQIFLMDVDGKKPLG